MPFVASNLLVRALAAAVLALAAFAGGATRVSAAFADDAVAPPGKPAPANGALPVVIAPQHGVLEFTGRLIVRPFTTEALLAEGMTAGDAQAQRERAFARIAFSIVKSIDVTGEHIVRVPAGKGDAAYCAELMQTGDYQYAEPDWLCFPGDWPDDPLIANQYHHVLMDSGQAWDLATGAASVVVAVVDTGIDTTHPDLAPRLVPGYNVPDDLEQAAGGDVEDTVGHGTATAGCAAATGNNTQGICGVGWNLSIMPIRVSNLPSGGAPLSALLAGARYAADHGAKAVNVSYTGVQNASVNTTGTYIKSRGGLLVWSAGNSRSDLSFFDHADVLVVSATDEFDRLAGFSSYGLAIDCAAAGVQVFTTTNNGDYGFKDGTSFAAPLVSGLVGLIFSANPSLTPDDAQAALLRGCDRLGPTPEGTPSESNSFGSGRINAFRSVYAAVNGLTAPVAADDRFALDGALAATIDPLVNDSDFSGLPIAIVAVDAVSSAGGTVAILPGAGTGGRTMLRYQPPGASGGATGDTFTYTVTNGLAASVATVHIDLHAQGDFLHASMIAPLTAGLDAVFYGVVDSPEVVPDFSTLTPVQSVVWSDVDFLPTFDQFGGSIFFNSFATLARGYFVAPATGSYTFWLVSADGSRLLIDGQLVVDNDGLHGPLRRSGSVLLDTGPHEFRLEYFDLVNTPTLIAEVAGPGLNRQPIPAGLLSRAGNPVDFNGDGTVNADDLSDFITAYFAGDGFADFNRDGLLNSDDLADFVTAFFAP